jgi:hypothetical protein
VDKRKNNGGHSTAGKAGRKAKDEEQKASKLAINALSAKFGSLDKAFEFVAGEAKDSFPHLKLLLEYAFGKPKETIEQTTNIKGSIPIAQWLKDQLKDDSSSSEV